MRRIPGSMIAARLSPVVFRRRVRCPPSLVTPDTYHSCGITQIHPHHGRAVSTAFVGPLVGSSTRHTTARLKCRVGRGATAVQRRIRQTIALPIVDSLPFDLSRIVLRFFCVTRQRAKQHWKMEACRANLLLHTPSGTSDKASADESVSM